MSRRQLLAGGLTENDVRRLLRRRNLVRVHPGVMVDHNGPLTHRQRLWAAVLLGAPAALWGPSALSPTTTAGAGASGPVHVAVDLTRRVNSVSGVRVHRVSGLEGLVLWNGAPPRVRAEVALVEVAATAHDELTAIAVLADAVRNRTTTPERLRAELSRRRALRRRRLLTDVVGDLVDGTDSVLELRYLTDVERAHGLPRGERQARLEGLRARHDVVHRDERVVVELDGRAHHSSTHDRFRDLERDTSALLAGHVTVRVGWGQVVGHPCRTARTVAELLRARGWTGAVRRCPRCEPN